MSDLFKLEDIVVLIDKYEFEDHIGRELTDEEWQLAKQKFYSNKVIWQAVDEAISELIDVM